MSFTDAAGELGLTPTAISHQVRLLEDYCGEKLFRRRPRPLALTEAGARLFPGLREGFDAFAAAVAAIGGEAEAMPLRITTTSAFASRWLVPRLASWRAAHPAPPLAVIGADRVLNLDADEADLAIRYARTEPPGAEPEIFRDRFYPVCAPKLLAEAGPVASAADLARLPLIHFDWFANSPWAPTWDRWLAAASGEAGARPGASPPAAFRYREEAHAIEAALAGQGVVLASDVVVADDLAAGRLVRAFDFGLPGCGFYPVFRSGPARRPIAEAFVAWLRAAAAGA